jgi:menaquinone-dependent protoporphyrinogen oxidase
MKRFLILFSTTDGHTFDISNRIKEVIEEQEDIQVDIGLIIDHMDIVFEQYDKVILGVSIRYGKHNPEVYTFIETHLNELDKIDNAFFSVNVVARKPEKNTPETNPYMVKFLSQIEWKPKKLAVFGGKLEYPKYSFWDRTMIRLIMWMTKGPTAPDTVVEYTNWKKVEQFAKEFSVRPVLTV